MEGRYLLAELMPAGDANGQRMWLRKCFVKTRLEKALLLDLLTR